MKKPYFDLTIGEAEDIIKCKNENCESMCRKGCPFHYTESGIGYCHKNAFLSKLFSYCANKDLISQNDDGDLEIELK